MTDKPRELYEMINEFMVKTFEDGLYSREAERILNALLYVCANIILSLPESKTESRDEYYSAICDNLLKNLLDIIQNEEKERVRPKATPSKKEVH